ncbi:MAG: hypothetical protein ACPKM0_03480 [Pleomorphochaeta sp.]
MKKRKISLLIVLSIVFLLSSCDISTLLDSFKGNVYEDVFDMDLVGEQAQDAVNSVVEASEPESVSEDEAVDSSGNVNVGEDAVDTIVVPDDIAEDVEIPTADVDDVDDLTPNTVAVFNEGVPTLPVQDEDEKDEIKATVNQALSGEGEDSFIESLEEDAEEEQIIAAHNTKVIANKVLNKVNGELETSGVPEGVSDAISALADELGNKLPENPTQADILNAQLVANLANSMVNALTVMAGDGDLSDIDDIDTDDPEVQEALDNVRSDAAFLINVARAQGATSDLINSIDLTNILSLFEGDGEEARLARAAITDTVDENFLPYLNAFKTSINLVLTKVLGVDITSSTPEMDYETFKAAVSSYSLQRTAFDLFVSSSEGLTYETIDGDQRSKYCGITGVVNYTLATVFDNVKPALDKIEEALEGGSTPYTIEEIVNLVLQANTDFIDPSEYTAPLEYTIPDGISDIDIEALQTELDITTSVELYITNVRRLAELGVPKNDLENSVLIQLVDEIETSIDDALNGGESGDSGEGE